MINVDKKKHSRTSLYMAHISNCTHPTMRLSDKCLENVWINRIKTNAIEWNASVFCSICYTDYLNGSQNTVVIRRFNINKYKSTATRIGYLESNQPHKHKHNELKKKIHQRLNRQESKNKSEKKEYICALISYQELWLFLSNYYSRPCSLDPLLVSPHLSIARKMCWLQFENYSLLTISSKW